jgi:hypothetical protein
MIVNIVGIREQAMTRAWHMQIPAKKYESMVNRTLRNSTLW